MNVIIKTIVVMIFLLLSITIYCSRIVGAFKKIFKNKGTLDLACNDKKSFFTSTDPRGYKLWSCQNVCYALSFLLDNVYIRYGNMLYRQIVGIPMGTNCASLVADCF